MQTARTYSSLDDIEELGPVKDAFGMLWYPTRVRGTDVTYLVCGEDGRRKYTTRARPAGKALKAKTLLHASARSYREAAEGEL